MVPIHAHSGKLHVVTAISNPVRYRSRYRLYRQFAQHVADAGAELTTVEVAFGSRPFEVTDAGHSRHIQLRSREELWFKENALNIGISRLPADAEYTAVVDADFTFARRNEERARESRRLRPLQRLLDAVEELDGGGAVDDGLDESCEMLHREPDEST